MTQASKEEGKVVQNYVNGLVVEHQQVMQQTIDSQQGQKDYVDSWVHEIKVFLVAVELVLHSLEDDIPEKKYYLLENELGKIEKYVEQVLYYARLDSFSRDSLIQDCSIKKMYNR